MKKVRIQKRDYFRYPNGVMVPAELVRDGEVIKAPVDVMAHLEAYRFESQECFLILTLDGSHQLIQLHEVTRGLVNKSQCHPREVFRRAILDNAVSVILAHNHPSGNLALSAADIGAIKKLVEASRIIGIEVLDHLVVSPKGHGSAREENPELFI